MDRLALVLIAGFALGYLAREALVRHRIRAYVAKYNAATTAARIKDAMDSEWERN
jgi:hypothetical protein